MTLLERGEVAEWLKAADCKSARVAYVGSNPTLTTISSVTEAACRQISSGACPGCAFGKTKTALQGGCRQLKTEEDGLACPRKSLIDPSRM